jgi:hypothetical protein
LVKNASLLRHSWSRLELLEESAEDVMSLLKRHALLRNFSLAIKES